MNKDTIKGSWRELKGKAQAKWGKLTNDELDQIEGNRERLVGSIQKSYGVARDEAAKQVDEWERAQERNQAA